MLAKDIPLEIRDAVLRIYAGLKSVQLQLHIPARGAAAAMKMIFTLLSWTQIFYEKNSNPPYSISSYVRKCSLCHPIWRTASVKRLD
ncbi:UNVERIFIED_ORG: hypothetical protein JN05_04493 [Zoogloea ramigera]